MSAACIWPHLYYLRVRQKTMFGGLLGKISNTEESKPIPRIRCTYELVKRAAQVTIVLISLASAHAQLVTRSDRKVLEALYEATGGPAWSDRTNWMSDAPLSDWFGVYTDRDGRVTSLRLSQNGLRGEIPPDLADLTNLQGLNLWGNELSGKIPPELDALAKLEWLHLGGNQLSGEIPPG